MPSGVRPVRAGAVAAAAIAAGIALVGTVARGLGIEWGPLAILVSLAPWLVILAAASAALALIARAWILAGVSAVLLAVGVAFALPVFTATPSSGEAVFTVATINLEFGQADPAEVVALVRDRQVDVLAVEELTPVASAALADAGLEELLPHSRLAATDGATGTGLYSRLALADARVVDGLSSRVIRASVTVTGSPITVFAVHPAAPGLRSHARWSADLDALEALLAAESGPVVVAGDFNTTRDHRGFRALEAEGFSDAANDAGAGIAATFPVGRSPVPFVAIDHVIERATGLVAARLDAVVLTGTDHRALVVEYAKR